MEDVEDEVAHCLHFIRNFNQQEAIDEGYLEFREAPKVIACEDLNAEILDWVFGYLKYVNCPLNLSAAIARDVQADLKSINLEAIVCDGDSERGPVGYERERLWKVVVNRMRDAFDKWHHVSETELRSLLSTNRREVSVCAIKNGRRMMEDRHVVIPSVNVLFGIEGDVPTSFYAIFDGHAGTEAASYAAVHLHYNIISQPSYPKDVEKAIKDGFRLTDEKFIEKCNREGLKSGSTAVCCLMRGKQLYVAWLGDSQAVPVRSGQPVSIMQPHKPDREDERNRIEKLGGVVLHFGTWRVNGTLAVSRALGDAEYKPYVSSEPDVAVVDLDGTDDFVVLACDGLWDGLQPDDVAETVYAHLVEDIGDVNGVSAKLIQVAKSKGSSDNITVITLFLRDVNDICSSIPYYKVTKEVAAPEGRHVFSADGDAGTDSPSLNGGRFIVEESPLSESALPYNPFGTQHGIDTSGFKDSGVSEHVPSPKGFREFSSEWDESGLKYQQQHFLEREIAAYSELQGSYKHVTAEMDGGNPFYDSGPKGSYDTSGGGNFYQFTGQESTFVQNSVAFSSSSSTDWPDKASNIEGQLLEAFDDAKAFRSNLSPDAKPFVMRDTTGLEPSSYLESTESTSASVIETLDTDLWQQHQQNAPQEVPQMTDFVVGGAGTELIGYNVAVQDVPTVDERVHRLGEIVDTGSYLDNSEMTGTGGVLEGCFDGTSGVVQVESWSTTETPVCDDVWEALDADKARDMRDLVGYEERVQFNEETLKQASEEAVSVGEYRLEHEQEMLGKLETFDESPTAAAEDQSRREDVASAHVPYGSDVEELQTPEEHEHKNLFDVEMKDDQAPVLQPEIVLERELSMTVEVDTATSTISGVPQREVAAISPSAPIEEPEAEVPLVSATETTKELPLEARTPSPIKEFEPEMPMVSPTTVTEVATLGMAATPSPTEEFPPELHETSPTGVTDEPIAITDEASAITDEPIAITNEAIVITDEPIAITNEAIVITDELIAITDEPIAITDEPIANTDEPIAITDEPIVITEDLTTTTPSPTEESMIPATFQTVTTEEPSSEGLVAPSPTKELSPEGLVAPSPTKELSPELSAAPPPESAGEQSEAPPTAEVEEQQPLIVGDVRDVEVAVEKIPEGILVAEGVEDDESEDGEEWKFYRTEGNELKPSTVESDVSAEAVTKESVMVSEHLQSSSSGLDANLSLVESEIAPLESSDELRVPSPERPIVEKVVEVEKKPAEVVIEVVGKKTKAKETTKPKSGTAAKVTARLTVQPPSKAPAPTKRPTGSVPSAPKTAAATGKPGATKTADVKKPPLKVIPATSAPVAGSAKGKDALAAKGEVAAKKPAAAARQKPPAKVEAPKPQPRPAPSSNSATTTTTTTMVKKTVGTTAKVTKEQNDARSKAPPASGTTSASSREVKAKAGSLSTEKRMSATSSSATARPATKTATTTALARKDPAKPSVPKVDAKQMKETVNKQISGNVRKVGTTVVTSRSTVQKTETSTSVKASPKNVSTVTSNGVTPERKIAATSQRSTPQTSTPKSKTGTPKPLVTASAKLMVSATTTTVRSSTATVTSRMSATQSSVLKTSRTPPLVSKSKGSPAMKSPGKTPVRSSPTSKSKAPLASTPTKTVEKDSLLKVTAEEGANEKGILDAASRESAPFLVEHNGGDHVAVCDDAGMGTQVVATNGMGLHHPLDSPEDNDDRLANGQVLQLHQVEDGLLLV